MPILHEGRSQSFSTLCRTTIATLMVVTVACGTSDKRAVGGDTGRVTMSPPVAVRPPAPGDSSCPRTGLWQPCALVDRIVHAGVSFKPTGDTVRPAHFKVPGIQYRVALTDTMVVFYFADSVALRDAIAPLDTLRMVPKSDSTMPWPTRPAVIRSGNLLALYFAKSDRQIERIKLAITAGAPN